MTARRTATIQRSSFDTVLCLSLWLWAVMPAQGAPYVAVDAARAEQPPIVIHHDAETGAGFDWSAMNAPRLAADTPAARLRHAVQFVAEGVRRMTGVTLPVTSRSDISRGIVFVLRRHAPPALRDDPAIVRGLRNDGSDAYNDREAFVLRSERDRLLIIANTVDGLVAAVPALLESVGYEVLGMGPNWTHVPSYRDRLVFDIDRADRPSFYLRQLTPTSGQSYGVGTITVGPRQQLTHADDEPVTASYQRWAIGIRNHSRSMPHFPGHAMYIYHKRVVEEMRNKSLTDGFLTPANHLGLDTARPEASEANRSQLWINTDEKGQPAHGKVYLSNGKTWEEQPLVGMSVNVDLSTPYVREFVLAEMKQRAIKHFADYPEEPFVFGTEPEDGAGYQNIRGWMRPQSRNWYPDYLKSRGATWPKPYVLHGYRGIDQPVERWDHGFPADVVFAYNNWLLSEFDRWIDSLPEAERVTSAGLPKKDLVRCSLYSYAYHDVAPHINLDPRIRVMIAGYPKHRGLGEWKPVASQHDMAAVFKKMLPREPSGEYRIISISYYADYNLEGIPARWSAAPNQIVKDLKGTLDAGVRALTCETDFNFGKYGLAYYLMSKVLWNANLSPAELEALRDRWLQRAYGDGWREMKAYYDFLLVENYSANGPGTWAKAIRLIDAADAKIDPANSPAFQKRIDDLKQYWYFYYLMDRDQFKGTDPEFAEFCWKGQMSYMTAMHMAVKRGFGPGSNRVETLLPSSLRHGPAHYSSAETATWWKKMQAHWPALDVANFVDAKLADGRAGRDVDLNDLVAVADFQALNVGKPFLFNSAQAPLTPFLTVARAGEPIGFRFAWPANDEVLRFYGPKDVPYGIEYWDAGERKWVPVADITLAVAPSQRLTETKDGKPRHQVSVEQQAPRTGTYRIEVGRGGFLAQLTSLGFAFETDVFTTRRPHTYFSRLSGLTQDPVYIYIPKGTRSVDLENWGRADRMVLQLGQGVSAKGLTKPRDVDISGRGTRRVKIEPGEDGQLARLSANGFAFPLLYSIPSLWAKSPTELLVPRAIAEADGLKIAEGVATAGSK